MLEADLEAGTQAEEEEAEVPAAAADLFGVLELPGFSGRPLAQLFLGALLLDECCTECKSWPSGECRVFVFAEILCIVICKASRCEYSKH